MSREVVRLCLVAVIALVMVVVQTDRSDASVASEVASGAPDAEPEITLDRASLVREVLERNRALAEARQAWQAVGARVLQATVLDDPTVSYSLAPLSVGSSDMHYGQVLRFGQRFPYPGKRRLAGVAVEEEVEVSRLSFEALRLELAMLASQLFDEYYYAHRALEINAEHIELLGDFQRIAIAQYKAGIAAQQDPIQAEVGLAHLFHQTVVLETQRDTLRSQINALQHRAPEEPLPRPPTALPPPAMDDVEPGEVQEQALAQRPELGAAAAEIRSREADLALRKLDFRPDFEAMASFNSMWNQSEHRWMVGAGINIPIRRNRIRASVAEAEARLAGADAGREALEDSIRSEVQQACARLGETVHVLELYETRLLPATKDQVQAALAGFKASRTSFLALIEAERNQRTVRLEYERALADAWQRRAELDRLMGRFPAVSRPPDVAAFEEGQKHPNTARPGEPR
jgi:outer membrane protein, heavy metal efflux system